MEENKNNEVQGTETNQPVSETELLRAVNEELQKKYDAERKTCLRYYRQVNVLKGAIKKLTEYGKVTAAEAQQAIIEGASLKTIDDLLYALSD